MGNYNSTQSTSNSNLPEPVVYNEISDQESKLPIMYAIIKNDEEFLYSDCLQKAKSYVNSCIKVDFEENFGQRMFVDEVEYENMIIYTLNCVDPTSLFCKTNLYCNYKILICKGELAE